MYYYLLDFRLHTFRGYDTIDAVKEALRTLEAFSEDSDLLSRFEVIRSIDDSGICGYDLLHNQEYWE